MEDAACAMTRAVTNNAKNRVTFPDLDVAKFLMAFLVVEIHTRPFGISSFVQGIDCVAVPFFFVASAFLCFRGLDAADFVNRSSAAYKRVWKTIKKVICLYIRWTVAFIPVSVFGYVMNDIGPVKAIVSFIRGTLLVGENIYSWPLWYLLASFIAFFLALFLLRGGGTSKIRACGCRDVCPARVRHVVR